MKQPAHRVKKLRYGREARGRTPRPVVAALAIAVSSSCSAGAAISDFEVTEASILELQEALEEGRTTSVALVHAYMARIMAYDRGGPRLNSVLRVNANALIEAAALDRERAGRGARGPLHGVPVIVKDNFNTADMPTTAGSIALAGLVPPDDGHQVRRLREAGAIILAKANLYELALDWTTVSSLGGVTRNPYDLGRTPGGSSGGTAAAVSASLAAVGWGSDTCGSIRLPASHTALFGLRPTRGLSSTAGIIPLSHTQDAAGPLARTATDLAIALDATIGPDPDDEATRALQGRELPRFFASLDTAALRGSRLGILTNYYAREQLDPDVADVIERALVAMGDLGAELEEVEIPDLADRLRGFSLERHEFKWDLMDYLSRASGAPVTSLTEILERGLIHEDAMGLARRYDEAPSRQTEAYAEALARRPPLRESTLRLLEERGLDALVYPVVRRRPAPLGESQEGSTCALSAATGLPALAVPAGFTDGGLPVGIELLGRAMDDAPLVALGYAFEQAEHPRRPPSAVPPLSVGTGAGEPAATSPDAAYGGPLPPRGSTALRGEFAFDPETLELLYRVEVSGIPAEFVHAIVLRRLEGDGADPITHRLSRPGVSATSGALALEGWAEALMAGQLYVEAFTARELLGGVREPVRVLREGTESPAR
jgi:Asp-tRNA(Asn)/Glu-tRNA(Gln) amidotransferase A subunit family amidase